MSIMYHCFIESRAPVHIGCDEVYEPFGFRVDDKNYDLIAFSHIDFVGKLDDDMLAQFSAICRKGTITSLLEVYKFVRKTKMEGKRVKVSPAFVQHYNTTLNLSINRQKEIQQNLNRFTIWRTAFLPGDTRPYIPGSSLKGSLRTAYLNARAGKKKLRRFSSRDAKKLERTLLDGGAFSTDPFRCIKVSDFMPVGDVRTRIFYAVNEKKTISRFKARGPYQILEVIEPGSIFVGTITLETPHANAGIERPISFKDLLSSLTTFYTKEKNREDNQLRRVGINTIPISGNGGEYLIRLGRHSGAESVTIEGHRSIKIMKKRGEKPVWSKEATTFWLASDEQKPKTRERLLQFGWATLRKAETENLQQFEEKERLWQTEKARRQALRLEEIGRQKEESLKKARELEIIQAEEERKKREEEERKAYLESLSPEERDITKVKDPSTPEQEVVQIFNRIDQFPENKRKELAEALKKYWEGMDKWKGKLSNKQKIKVRKIKEILGET